MDTDLAVHESVSQATLEWGSPFLGEFAPGPSSDVSTGLICNIMHHGSSILYHYSPYFTISFALELHTCLASEGVLDGIVSGLGLVVKVLDGSRSFTCEYSWNPAGLVSESPCISLAVVFDTCVA